MKTLLTLLTLLFVLPVIAGENMASKDFHKAITTSGFTGVILDIRTPNEWRDTGIVKGAITQNAFAYEFKDYLSKLDKSKTYYVYCKSGGRSGKATKMMDKLGLNNVNINDGMMGWKNHNLPTVPYTEKR